LLSGSSYATLSASIPIYNYVMDQIEDLRDGENVGSDICNATDAAYQKLQEYYVKARSPTYSAATSMFCQCFYREIAIKKY
jgi:hypothetical protein